MLLGVGIVERETLILAIGTDEFLLCAKKLMSKGRRRNYGRADSCSPRSTSKVAIPRSNSGSTEALVSSSSRGPKSSSVRLPRRS